MLKSWVIIVGIMLAVVPWMSGGSDPLAIVVSAFSLLISIFLLSQRPEQMRTATLPLRLVTLLWLGWGILSIIWSVNRYDSELWLLFAGLGVLVFAATASLNLEEKARLLTGYVWIATIAAVYGLYLYFTGDYDRLTSSFYWANPCAAFLIPAAFISGWRWLSRTGKERRAWTAGVLIIQLLILSAAIWLTDSRGALLAAGIVFLAVLLSRGVRRRLAWIAAVIVLSFGLSLAGSALRTHYFHHAAVTPGSRFAAAASGESTSLQDRRNYLLSALAIWRNHPLLGSGAGTYGVEHPKYQRQVTSASNDAHNILAQTAAEQGLIGLLILIYVVVVMVVGVWRGVAREPRVAVAAAGAAVLALHFGIDIDDRYPALIALLAMLLGTSYATWKPRPVKGWQRWRTPSLLLIVLVISVAAYQSSIWLQRGQASDNSHDLTTAANNYAKAHSGWVYDPDAWDAEGIDYYTLAGITNGSKRYLDSARSDAMAAIARDPDDSQHYFLLARIDRLSGQADRAEHEYQQALRLDPGNHPEYYVDLASLQLQQGDTDTARMTVETGIDLYPDAVIANRNADANLKPAVSQLLALRAADRLRQGDQSRAAADIKRALRLDPASPDAKTLQHIQAQSY